MNKALVIIGIGIINAFSVNAQKLPKVQKAGVRAPANIKIDGKTTEWDGKFQAHNSGQHMYYTVSNDENNLYLTVLMDENLGTRKIFKGGLTFKILPLSNGSKDIAITFPITNVGFMKASKSGATPFQDYKLLTKKNTTTNKAKIDSLIASNNVGMENTYKKIYITGMSGVNDPSVPINNTFGIQVGASFDKTMNYTYELAIPLNYLQDRISDAKKLKYVLGTNALSPIIKNNPTPPPAGATELKVATQLAPESIDDIFIYNDTDFSGEYVLVNND